MCQFNFILVYLLLFYYKGYYKVPFGYLIFTHHAFNIIINTKLTIIDIYVRYSVLTNYKLKIKQKTVIQHEIVEFAIFYSSRVNRGVLMTFKKLNGKAINHLTLKTILSKTHLMMNKSNLVLKTL